jgi:hypothetical protein
MHFKAKNVAALQTLLEGWPDGMRVEADPGLGVSAKTVGELRKVLDWPDNLTITTPPGYSPGGNYQGEPREPFVALRAKALASRGEFYRACLPTRRRSGEDR